MALWWSCTTKAESKYHSVVRGASHQMSCLFNWKDFCWKAHIQFLSLWTLSLALSQCFLQKWTVNIYMPFLTALRNGEHLETDWLWFNDLLTHCYPCWFMQKRMDIKQLQCFGCWKKGGNLISSYTLCYVVFCSESPFPCLFFFPLQDFHGRQNSIHLEFTWTQSV